jgi:hypothetical protein
VNATELQQWLGTHGQPVLVDGQPGPLTRKAIRAAFTISSAPAVTDADLTILAARLGCTAKQIKAVAKVESGASAFDKFGRPKILFERHLFFRLTAGRFGHSAWSDAAGGGYNEDSWDKLAHAACEDADAAFSATSWGRFQILGMHWQGLHYPSPIDMAYSTVTGEAAHYEMFARYLERNNLVGALRAISTNPADNVALAKGYNGPAYAKFSYDTKLAEAMA